MNHVDDFSDKIERLVANHSNHKHQGEQDVLNFDLSS